MPKKPAAAPARVQPHSPKHQTPPAAARMLRMLRLCRALVAAGIAGSAAACTAVALHSVEGLVSALILGFLAVLLAVAAVLQHRSEREVTGLGEAYRRAEQLAELNSSVIASFAMAIDAKDQHTHGHTERVRDIATMISEEMKFGADEIEALRTAAMLHDIGKLAVPDYILSKTEQLTQEEMKKIQTHTLVGAAILEPVMFPWPVVPIIRSHHEWYDGTGYPDGLAGDQIPLGARVLAVADVYDALLSHRPYRAAMTVQEAVSFMRERSGTQFDPEILNLCFKVLSSQRAQNRLGFIFNADASDIPPGAMDASGQRAIFMDIRQAHQDNLPGALLAYIVRAAPSRGGTAPLCFLRELGYTSPQLGPQLVGALVLGHDGEHGLQGLDLLFRRPGLPVDLLSLEVLGGQIRWHLPPTIPGWSPVSDRSWTHYPPRPAASSRNRGDLLLILVQ